MREHSTTILPRNTVISEARARVGEKTFAFLKMVIRKIRVLPRRSGKPMGKSYDNHIIRF